MCAISITKSGSVFMENDWVASLHFWKGEYIVVWVDDDLPVYRSGSRDGLIDQVLSEIWD